MEYHFSIKEGNPVICDSMDDLLEGFMLVK